MRAYQQISVRESGILKTAIITPDYHSDVLNFLMTFGLRNAAQIFQRFMDRVTAGLDFCFTYIDDILIASQDEIQHKEHLKILFDRLQQYGIAINPNKCI